MCNMTRFVAGLQQVSSMTGIQDRVGLACYGEDTQLVLKPTTDYNKIRREIGNISFRVFSTVNLQVILYKYKVKTA